MSEWNFTVHLNSLSYCAVRSLAEWRIATSPITILFSKGNQSFVTRVVEMYHSGLRGQTRCVCQCLVAIAAKESWHWCVTGWWLRGFSGPWDCGKGRGCGCGLSLGLDLCGSAALLIFNMYQLVPYQHHVITTGWCPVRVCENNASKYNFLIIYTYLLLSQQLNTKCACSFQQYS